MGKLSSNEEISQPPVQSSSPYRTTEVWQTGKFRTIETFFLSALILFVKHFKSPSSTTSIAILNVPSHADLAPRHQILNLPLLNFTLQSPLRDKNVNEVSLGTWICAFADTRAPACIGLKRRWVTVTLRGVSKCTAYLSRSTENNGDESLGPCAQ